MDTNRQAVRKDGGKKKLAVILLSLALAVVLVFGSLFAFFSDILTGNQTFDAGTLDLTGSAKMYINGSTTEATVTELACLNPGDEIKAVITANNIGSKSAWIQGSFTLSDVALTGNQIGSAFTVYEGTKASGTLLTMVEGPHSIYFIDAGNSILDGTYEKETATGAIKAMTTDKVYTIVFKTTAGNLYQGAAMKIDYEVKALQYRNNPNPDWTQAVVVTP